MKQAIVWVLVAANVSLAGTLVWRGVRENTANAQAATPAAPGTGTLETGKYVLIPGESTVGVAMIYVFDSANRRLGALAPDSREQLQVMPSVALDEVFEKAAVGVRPNDNTTPGRRQR